jgi:acyl carrier protein phosphodiesterase
VNYLAHILLSGHDSQWQLGGYLGDFIKGPLGLLDPLLSAQQQRQQTSSDNVPLHLLDAQGNPWSQSVLQGVALHRRLDVFTDSHDDYKRCLALLGPDCRRFAPIALDVFVDHILSLHWAEFHDASLDDFSGEFYRFCTDHQACLPQGAASFIERAAQYHLFAGYARWDVFERVLQSIDQRIRFKSNVAEVGTEIYRHYDALTSILLPFIALAKQYAEHWRIERGV